VGKSASWHLLQDNSIDKEDFDIYFPYRASQLKFHSPPFIPEGRKIVPVTLHRHDFTKTILSGQYAGYPAFEGLAECTFHI
jgi:hypothetical protein